MSREDDHEPPFVRSDWGTNRYVYNHRSPIGRSFIVISLAIAAGGLLYPHIGPSWSEEELRDAVGEVPAVLATETYGTGSAYPADGIGGRVREAVVRAGGPWAPDRGVDVEAMGSDGPYEVTVDGVDAVFCVDVLRVPAYESYYTDSDTYEESTEITGYELAASYSEGRCVR